MFGTSAKTGTEIVSLFLDGKEVFQWSIKLGHKVTARGLESTYEKAQEKLEMTAGKIVVVEGEEARRRRNAKPEMYILSKGRPYLFLHVARLLMKDFDHAFIMSDAAAGEMATAKELGDEFFELNPRWKCAEDVAARMIRIIHDSGRVVVRPDGKKDVSRLRSFIANRMGPSLVGLPGTPDQKAGEARRREALAQEVAAKREERDTELKRLAAEMRARDLEEAKAKKVFKVVPNPLLKKRKISK